jgi:hypothetical protein
MFPIIFGFAAALAFNAVAVATYGTVALSDSAWVDMVSWGLIAGGAAVYVITRPTPAWLCRLTSVARTWLRAKIGPDVTGLLRR